MSTFGKFKMDVDRETKGIWVQYGSAGEFLVARAGGSNKAYRKEMARLVKESGLDLEDPDEADNEEAIQLLMAAFSKTVIRGWKSVTDPEGNELKFSAAKCLWLFKELPDLFHAIRDDAGKLTLFRANLREKAAKNS